MENVAEAARAAWQHALDTFGTEERALRWMRMPLSELGGRTPEEVLAGETPDAAAAVDAILTRIDYGVYA
jgi:putative toxin-antitoxin system antitoxin component (TIGR02293 family)